MVDLYSFVFGRIFSYLKSGMFIIQHHISLHKTGNLSKTLNANIIVVNVVEDRDSRIRIHIVSGSHTRISCGPHAGANYLPVFYFVKPL